MDLDLNTVVHRQKLFRSTLKSYFLRKITKYQNVLLKNGIHLSDCEDSFAIPRSQSFEDHIELVIGEKSASPNACKTLWKIGNRISTIKLFRWIYLIVQRTKAARILHHLDGISDVETEAVINSVGHEIAVAFEYQICLLEGDLEVIKLAQHAGACIVTYLNSKDADYAPENLLQAILEIKPNSNGNKEILKTRTVCFNNQPVCLRWRLSQVLKQPGLRATPRDLGETINEELRPSEDNKPPNDDDENVDEQKNNSPHGISIEMDQSSINEQDDYEQLNISLEDPTPIDNILVYRSHSSSEEITEEDIDIASDSRSSAREEGRLIDEAELKKTRKHRRISAVDMDFENRVMKVTDYSVDASDFSSVGNDISRVDDSDATSIDEDLDTEIDGKSDILDCGSNTGIISVQENAKQVLNEAVDNSSDMKMIKGNDSTDSAQKDDEMVNKDTCSVNLENSAWNNGSYFNTEVYNRKGEDNDKEMPKADGALKNEVSAVNISHDKVDTQSSINNEMEDFLGPQTLHINQSISIEKPSKFLNASEPDKHRNESDHIKEYTYQPNMGPSNISNETVVQNCDDSMLEFATVDKSYIFYGCFTPYGAKCRPKIYGYRGPLHVWNEVERCYTLIYNDTVTVARKHQRQIAKCSQDFHQVYIPKTECRH